MRLKDVKYKMSDPLFNTNAFYTETEMFRIILYSHTRLMKYLEWINCNFDFKNRNMILVEQIHREFKLETVGMSFYDETVYGVLFGNESEFYLSIQRSIRFNFIRTHNFIKSDKYFGCTWTYKYPKTKNSSEFVQIYERLYTFYLNPEEISHVMFLVEILNAYRHYNFKKSSQQQRVK